MAPEVNPREHALDEGRETESPSQVLNRLDGIIRQLKQGLPCLAANPERLCSLATGPGIISLSVNAY